MKSSIFHRREEHINQVLSAYFACNMLRINMRSSDQQAIKNRTVKQNIFLFDLYIVHRHTK